MGTRIRPKRTAVIDAGTGNLHSVVKALDAVGARPFVTRDAQEILHADRVVVPGQGAFGEWLSNLKGRGLESVIREVIANGKPYFGICLGLQVLFDESEEYGPVAGLGIVPGKVVRFTGGPGLPVPHIGWNRVTPGHGGSALLGNLPAASYFYFIHSYYVVPDDPRCVVLDCEYGEHFAAAIAIDNIFACQFHPEKSQRLGLRLLANFVEST